MSAQSFRYLYSTGETVAEAHRKCGLLGYRLTYRRGWIAVKTHNPKE